MLTDNGVVCSQLDKLLFVESVILWLPVLIIKLITNRWAWGRVSEISVGATLSANSNHDNHVSSSHQALPH